MATKNNSSSDDENFEDFDLVLKEENDGFVLLDEVDKIKEQSSQMYKFIKRIFSIIFYTRKKSTHFLRTKSQNKVNQVKDNLSKSHDGFFPIDLEDLLEDEYENLRCSSNEEEGKKYNINFYLTKCKNKILVEKWVISYSNENKFIYNKTNFDEYMNKKFNVLQKSIICFCRLLPLFNIINLYPDEYQCDFEFNPKNNKEIFKEKTSKVKISNDFLFNFNLSIEYLTKSNIDKIISRSNSSIRKKVRNSFVFYETKNFVGKGGFFVDHNYFDNVNEDIKGNRKMSKDTENAKFCLSNPNSRKSSLNGSKTNNCNELKKTENNYTMSLFRKNNNRINNKYDKNYNKIKKDFLIVEQILGISPGFTTFNVKKLEEYTNKV